MRKVFNKVAQKLAFIGAGIIAEVWIDRLVQTAAIGSEDWMMCDTDDKRLERLSLEFGHKRVAKDAPRLIIQ